jgi:hypothetical protein
MYFREWTEEPQGSSERPVYDMKKQASQAAKKDGPTQKDKERLTYQG